MNNCFAFLFLIGTQTKPCSLIVAACANSLCAEAKSGATFFNASRVVNTIDWSSGNCRSVAVNVVEDRETPLQFFGVFAMRSADCFSRESDLPSEIITSLHAALPL